MNQAASSERIVPLVMCGGAGTRLWPSSREGRPKQFLPLLGSRSTFQETMLRVADVAVFARPIVITNIQYRFIVKEQLAEIGIEADILLEPMRRRFRSRNRGRCCVWRKARRQSGAGGARRRPYRYRQGCVRFRLSRSRRRCARRPRRHFWRQAGPACDRIRVYPSGCAAWRRRVCGRAIRREAG